MSGRLLSPLPSAPSDEPQGGFQNMPQFRTSLPVFSGAETERWFPPLVVMPSVPSAGLPAREWAIVPIPPVIMPEIVLPPERQQPVDCEAQNSFKAASDFSDEDLTEAFAPIVREAVKRAVLESDGAKMDAFLEPMLRATVRRALAEYSPASRPFQPPGFLDRTVWRMQALFSSRSFEDILFQKTHRFQVEEVFLFDAKTLALISFASCDPARHSSAKRVEGAAHRIALQIRDEAGAVRRSFEQADGRNVISEEGEHVLLVAIVRGSPNELILADLGFSLRRIEDHFRERFEQAGSALMHALQPFLEDCLLIQAPASAA